MQNKKFKPIFRFYIACLCFIILITNAPTSLATDSIEELEQSAANQQTGLTDLRTELLTLTQESEDLLESITETKEAVRITELNLVAAELSQQSQYQRMSKRIKYMYENGAVSLLELICSAESMSDFINTTSFVFAITEYDREQLEELQVLYERISHESQELAKQQNELAQMQQTLEEKRTTLSTKITSAEASLALTASQLAEARAVAASVSAPDVPAIIVNDDATSTSEDNTTNITQQPPIQTDVSELVLLAGILECEAGSTNYDALLAVATVILNRVNSGGYFGNANTIRDVIYQRGQFPPATNGKLDRILARGPASLCLTVAQDALNGARYGPVSHCLSFRAASSGQGGVVVGGNVFF